MSKCDAVCEGPAPGFVVKQDAEERLQQLHISAKLWHKYRATENCHDVRHVASYL